MTQELLRGITSFSDDEINTVYQRCYFQLNEERTAIIYEDTLNKVFLKIYVGADVSSDMYFEDLFTGDTTVISTLDEKSLICEDDNIDYEMCKSIIGRYLQLMDSFVQFAKAD